MPWDADKYTRDFSFVACKGRDLLALLNSPKGARVLDLGCGNGCLTNELAKSGYEAHGMDSSKELLALARRDYPHLPFIQEDALSFSCPQTYDAIFSNAVFHWITKKNQPQLLTNISNSLKMRGELVFEMGGFGNNLLIHKALAQSFASHGLQYETPFYFPKIGEYSQMLEGAGLLVKYAHLFDRPTELKGENGMAEWIKMFVREPFAAHSPETDAIINETQNLLKPLLFRNGRWYADYVRLRMRAVKI